MRPLLLLLIGAALAAGLADFARARPSVEVRFPRSAPEGGERRNLARFAEGSAVRVSSVLWAARHHPGYLVDGWADPAPVAKWVSAPGDAHPWAEVQLDRPREVDEVALELAAAHEPLPPERDYRVECFAGARLAFALPVADNALARPRHRVRCAGADRVRVTFAARDVARVYELEVWGR